MNCNVVIQSQFAWYYSTTYFQLHKSRTFVLSIHVIRNLIKIFQKTLQKIPTVLSSK
nr:MAG TPA: BssS protein family protein [Caudoviricetes sp.]